MASKKKVKVEISRGKYVESLNLKKLGLKRILKSFKFSFDGLKYAYLLNKIIGNYGKRDI